MVNSPPKHEQIDCVPRFQAMQLTIRILWAPNPIQSNPIQYTIYIPLQNFLPPLPNTPYSIAVRNMLKQVLCISFLLFFCLIISSCKAQNKNNNRNNPTCASSCGNLDNITFPFRLKGDPKYCGHSNYELDCQNDNTILTLNSKKFHVLAISYHNFSIRVVDPGLDNNNSCSFPTYSVSYDDLQPIFRLQHSSSIY